VKVYDTQGGIWLRVRDNTTRQDVLVCTTDIPETKRVLHQVASKRRVRFRLGENADE